MLCPSISNKQSPQPTDTSMECSVCYTEKPNCKLVCGHSFCHSCVKEWYLKNENEATCPMCRARLYFKGMYKMCKIWDEEKHQKQLEEIYGNCFDELFDEELIHNMGEIGGEFILDELYNMEWYFNKFKDEFDYEDLEDAVLDQYCDIAIEKFYPIDFVNSQSIFISKYSGRRLPYIYTHFV